MDVLEQSPEWNFQEQISHWDLYFLISQRWLVKESMGI